MRKKAAFIKNKYYSDEGMDYVYRALKSEFSEFGISLDLRTDFYAGYPFTKPDYDFAVFWDKDVSLAYRLQNSGLRIFNSARTIELCDDKEKTFAAVCDITDLPVTLVSPLCYDINLPDGNLTDRVESVVGYPCVVKECVGSQGRQVYLAHNRSELTELNNRLAHVPHLYQQFIEGDEAGSDIRVYIIGKKAFAAVKRFNTTDFRSNAALGGKMQTVELSTRLRQKAEKIAAALDLEYGSADFIKRGDDYVFIEANSSVYMANAQKLNINLAAEFVKYAMEAIK